MVEIASSGNIALVHGFLTYGLAASKNSDLVLFGAGYPITPVNDITEWGTRELPEHGGDFIQAESELAAINMVLGAASVGVPAFTVTSSPGISLMQEAISYAIGMEVPLVVADVVRGGPGLGNIQGAQSDLNVVLSGGHGDRSPIIFAPASCQEMYDHGRLAFEYANRYRTTAFVLSDGYIGQLKEKYRVQQVVAPVRDQLDRRELCSSIYVREGILQAHNWRLQRQFDRLIADKSLNELSLSSYLEENEKGEAADILIVSYGIFSRIGFGVVRRAREQGLSVGQVSLKVLSPFPEKALRQLARRHKALYVLEGSCGQLERLVRGAVGQIPLIGTTLFPGGGLPDENDVVENLRELSQKITPDYLKWKEEALGLENRIHSLQESLSPYRGSAYSLVPDEEATYKYENRENRKKRITRKNEIMTDVPFSYCAGCGETPAVNSMAKVLEQLRAFDTVLYSPVGCSIFIYDYFKPEFVRNIQVPHGRGPAAVSGSKRARPDKIQVIVQGDGDALDIGLNELIHCIERGENITTVIFNNGTYGMTGGQASSSTPIGEKTITTQMGRDPDRHGQPLDLAPLVMHPGVGYFRRALVGSPDQIHEFETFFANALYHQMAGHGVSIIEIFTACPSRQKPSPEFLRKLSDQGIQVKGKVMASMQYAAHVLPQGTAPMDVRRGEDVASPYEELEKLFQEQQARQKQKSRISVEDQYSKSIEIIRKRYGMETSGRVGNPSLKDLRVFMGGIGGQGVQVLADLLVKALGDVYRNFTNTPWYEPEVTRALTTVGLIFTNHSHINPILQPKEADLMVAMKRRVVEQRDSIIREGGLLLYDSADGELSQEGIDYQVNSIPATKIAQDVIKEVRSANIVLLGAMTRLLKEIDLDVVREIIQKHIPKPELNIEALEAGVSLIEEQSSVV